MCTETFQICRVFTLEESRENEPSEPTSPPTNLRVFLHGVTFAVLVFQNIKVAAMLVFQTNSVGVELISHVNVCRYLKRFYTYKKINNSFLKFDHSLLRMPKNNRNWSNLCCRKTRLKNITNPQINRFGPP